MQIHAIQNNLYKSKNPAFRHWERTVYKSGCTKGIENVVRRNNTEFFRNPDFWLDLIGFFEKKFNNVPKINVYSYGCSDGSDVLSLIISLIAHKRFAELEKISPILAKDIDSLAIERAKSNIYEVSPYEKRNIDFYTCGKFSDFFQDFSGKSVLVPGANMSISPELSKHIRYSKANILEDYKTIKPNNSIVLLRNTLPYINTSNNEPYLKGDGWQIQREFLEKLYNHLGENSYIAIGEYDRYEMKGELTKMLEDAGFEETSVYNLYRRVSNEEKTKGITFRQKVLKFFQKVFD